MIKASIIITAYNSASFIERAVQSALSQKVPRESFEVVIVDDGSTDNTLQVLDAFGSDIRILKNPHRGFVVAVNQGFREARGEYVTKLDSDDVFHENLLKEEVLILDGHQDIDFVYSDYFEKTGEEVTYVSTENIFASVAIGTMYRKEKLAAEGFWREGLGFPEYDIILRTWGRWHGYRVIQPLFTYIRRPESVSKTHGWQEAALQKLNELHPTHVAEVARIRKY